ncbi:MAG: AraC family transcriptional regulator, partial [Bacteroidota bacterium]
MIRAKKESILAGGNESFRLLLTPNLNDIFYWHFHPEVELVYAEAERGIRHIGDHVSSWKGSDLALIGSNIPHLNFDYGVKATVDTVVVQMMEDFLGASFFETPETARIKELMVRARTGLAFYGETKEAAGGMLKALPAYTGFERLLKLLEVFNLLADTVEYEVLHASPIDGRTAERERDRLNRIYRHVEENFTRPVDVAGAAAVAGITVPAFCRYFRQQA